MRVVFSQFSQLSQFWDVPVTPRVPHCVPKLGGHRLSFRLGLAEASVSPACAEYVVGKLTAFDKVLSLMSDLEELYDEEE